MKICFFGTGHGVAEAHKKCTATLLQVGESYYIIDAGCDIAYELSEKRVPFEKVRAIFVTHPHSDHTNGLLPFLTITNWYYTKADFTVFLPSEKLAHNYKEVVFPALERSLRPEQRMEAYQQGVIYDDGTLRVTAIPTQHCLNSYAFLLEAEGKRVLFTGDLKDPLIDFPPVDDLDAAVVEGVHFPLMNYEEVLKNKKIGVVYVHHYGNYIGRSNHRYFKPLQAALPMPIHFATDGMETEI